MFRWEHIEHFIHLLWILPVVACFVLFLVMRTNVLKKLGESRLVKQLSPQASLWKHWTKFAFIILAFISLTIALANPQWGAKREKVKRKSVDVFIALDISASMMAQDISPNRLERAKLFTMKLIRGLKGDRIGLIHFAGNAYLQMPLTTDYAAAQMFVKSANTKMAPTQGTAISDAIDLATESFEDNEKQHRALIIISDGENHEEEAIKKARQARDKGLLIFTLGVGSDQGVPIPIKVNGQSGFKRDDQNEIIRTKLNEKLLKEVASAGNGTYFNIRNDDQVVEALRQKISKIEKQEFEQRSFKEFNSYFQYFIGLAIFLLLVEFLISFRKNAWLAKRDFFETHE